MSLRKTVITTLSAGLLAAVNISCGDNSGGNPVVNDPQYAIIDLSAFNTYAGTADAEATPYASALARYGDSVYVACQRLKNFSPADVSLIVVVDARTDQVVGSITLNKQNPVSMDVFGDKLLVSSAGDYSGDAATGGVELIDLANRQNTGVVADGGEFSGHIGNVVFVSADKAYVSAYDADWNTEVVEINPATKTVGAKISGITSGGGGLACDGSKLYAGETGFGVQNGVLVINTNTNEIDTIIPTGMPPAAIVSSVNYIAVNTNDYTAANFEIISTENYAVTANIIPGLHTDCLMRAHGSDVYILERMGKDNVIRFSNGGIHYQRNIGTGLNIQDISIVSPAKAYITSYEKSYLIIIDPSTGTRKLAS